MNPLESLLHYAHIGLGALFFITVTSLIASIAMGLFK